MRYFYVVLALAMLSGCAAMGEPPSAFKDMSAEQIKAAVSDKSSSVLCISGQYAGANLNTIAVNVDKGVPSNLTIEQGCKLTFGSVVPSPTQSGSVSLPVVIQPMVLTPATPAK
jgi:hypothetical protein